MNKQLTESVFNKLMIIGLILILLGFINVVRNNGSNNEYKAANADNFILVNEFGVDGHDYQVYKDTIECVLRLVHSSECHCLTDDIKTPLIKEK